MKKPGFFSLIVLIFLILLTTTNQRISSSPGNLTDNKEQPVLSQSEKELTEMQDIFRDYDEWLTTQIAESGTVGAAVAITYKDQIAYLKCFGTRKAGSGEPIDEHTVFRLASVSKPITGVLTGILAQEQVLDFDEKVCETLPWLQLANQSSTRNITLRNLLSHTTGLVPHAYDDLVEGHVPFTTILGKLKEAGISSVPGKVYGYQNVMFSLVDTIMAVKTSKNFSKLVKEKLFDPVGMLDASTDFQSFSDNPNKAFPHRGANGTYRTLPLNDRYYTTTPAAGVNASITDMAHFLQALVDENNTIVGDNICSMIFEPQVNSILSRGYFKYWNQIKTKQYALGWRMVDFKNRQVAYHGGFVSGYKAEIAISRQDNIGIVYLSNSPNQVASQSIPVFLEAFSEFMDNRPVMAESENLKEDQLIAQDI